ncbi:unnamed protein product [Allacma fusca]|uniref:Uncharacterized protein n=1 Tax=Allacma fusca TaxID=39272 RepID=A0A8J2LAI1_9HEXA|nr:unnamed protein product [Allacma fusca]
MLTSALKFPIFKERTLRCYAAFVFFEAPKSVKGSSCSSTIGVFDLKLCPDNLEKFLKWVTPTMSPRNVRSDLVLIFHEESVSSELLSSFLQYSHKNLYGSPIFVLRSENAKKPDPTLEDHSENYSRKTEAFISFYFFDTWVTFNCYLYLHRRNGPEIFDCKASECYKRMMLELERVSNHGKRISWYMNMYPNDFKRKISPKLGSPLQRKEPLTLSQTTYEFLVGDLDSNFTDKFYGYSSPGIFFDVSDFTRGDIFRDESIYQEFPVSYTSSKNFITSDSVHAITLESKIYTTPFDDMGWIGIAGAVFFVALILTLNRFWIPGRLSFQEKFPIALLSVIGSLVDNSLKAQMFGLIAFWAPVLCKAFLEGKYVNQIASDVQNCVLTLVQIVNKPIDYSEISTPFMLRVLPENNFNMVQKIFNPSIFRERTLRCYAAFVFFEALDPLKESNWKSSCFLSNVLNLQLVKCELANAMNWIAESMTFESVRSDLIITFHPDPTPREFLSTFLYYTHQLLNGSPVFVLRPKNVMVTDADDKKHSNSNYSMETELSFPDSLDNFLGYFYMKGVNIKNTFHCKASECHKRMISEFERVSNHGKKISWHMTMLPQEIELRIGLNSGSPLQRLDPWDLAKTTYEFLVGDLDSNNSGSFYGKSPFRTRASKILSPRTASMP